MSRTLSRWQAVLLGGIVLIGLALAGLGLFAASGWSWLDRDFLNVRAAFSEIGGVEVGSWVRIQGIEAGTVEAVDPPAEPGAPVILHLRIRGKYRHLVRADATVRIVSEGLIGGKGLEIVPGRSRPGEEAADPVAEGALLRGSKAGEVDDLLAQAGGTLADLRTGKGTLGKLATDPQAHDALVALLQQSRETMTSIQRIASSVERLPLVGGYVENPVSILERPSWQRDRRCFAEYELFEPGRAVLTAQGRQRLDEVAPWLEGMKHAGSEVVVVSYADPRTANPQTAPLLTRQQSEAVREYLKSQHGVQKMGWLRTRDVIALGQGTSAPPTPEPAPLPPARTEVIVFIPQS